MAEETRLVAGHRIGNWSDRCMACGRSVNDVMSSAEGAELGETGVSCMGGLNLTEVGQVEAEKARRARMYGFGG